MAYATKYSIPYKSGNSVRTISLMLDGYSGAVTEWYCSVSAPVDEQGNSDRLFGDIIVPKVVRLEFLFDQDYDLTEFVAEPRTYKVVIEEGGNTIFSGFVEPYDTYRSYQKTRYFVTMTATCGLNRLSKNIFQQTEFNEGNLVLNYFELVQRCLATIGIERDIRVSVFTQLNSSLSAPNPLSSVEVNVFRYFVDGVWMDCQSIILDILHKFNAQLFLDGDTWVIRSFIDHALGFTSSYVYTPSGSGSVVGSWDIERTVNYEINQPIEELLTLKGGQISLTPRVRKYTTNVDLGGKDEQFTNGGLQLWDVNGPIGWTGNMGPALGGPFGWTKVETGIEGAPYALNIRGRAPHPYFKKKKKGIWPFRKTVLEPIEPAVYWETPEIEIKKTDESISIGFEYFTEADSGGFLYTVTLFRSNPVDDEVNRVYIKPDVTDFPYSDDYQLLIAPPHPKVNPDTGITQSKGRVEYNLDLKQLNTKYLSGPDQPFFDRVEIWFYFSNLTNDNTGDEYTIYKIIGEKTGVAESEVPDGDSRYKVILESNPYESDQGDAINLITGDYADGFLGTTLAYGASELEPTQKWMRRDNLESISIYRAMMLDRLAVTYEVGDVVQADIYTREGEEIRYLNLIRFKDRNPDSVYKIVRYSYNHYTRVASVLAVEVNYAALTTVKQRSYTEARGLLDESGEGGDGTYPGTGTPSGRIGAEEDDLFEEEVTPEELASARTGVFEDVPMLIYFEDQQATSEVDLLKFLSEGYLDTEQEEGIETEDQHDPEEFVLSVVNKPDWVTDVSFDGLIVSVTAKPTEIGDFTLELSVIDDTFGPVPNVKIPIRVYPEDVIEYTLKDTSTSAVEVGALPGAWPIPDRWNVDVAINVIHDRFKIQVKGGGGSGTSVDTVYEEPLLESVEEGIYPAEPYNGGFVSEPGIYKLTVIAYLGDYIVTEQTIVFTLYDEEYLAKATFELYDSVTGTKIGDITVDGQSSFVKPKNGFDVKMIVADTLHDTGIVELIYGSDVMKGRTVPQTPDVSDFEYFVYDEATSPQPAGEYQASLKLKLDGNQIFERLTPFVILEEEVEPKGGLILVRMIDGKTNHEVIEELPKSGGEFDLPDPGWNTLSEYEGEEIDYVEWFNFELRNGSYFEFDSQIYTGKPQAILYTTPVKKNSIRTFWNKSSVDIGSIHHAPSAFRQIVRRKIGGPTGEVVDIQMSDFSFRVPLSPADYSGLRFLTNDGGSLSVIDTNMPKANREYEIPVWPAVWATSVRSFGGVSFSHVRIKVRKFISGSFLTLHLDGSDYVHHLSMGGSFTELPNDSKALFEAPVSGTSRTLKDPSSANISIDEPGRYEVTYVAYLNTTIVATKVSDFTLVDPLEEDPPLEDCCGNGTFVVYAGMGLNEIVDDRLKTLNVVVDGTTIGINGSNALEVLDLDPSFLGEFLPRTVLGNMLAVAGYATQVSVINNMTLASFQTLADSLTIKNYVDSKATAIISGTVGRIPKFITANTIGDSIARELTGTYFIDGFLIVGTTTNERIRMSSDTSNSFLNFTDSALTARYGIHSQATRLGFEVGSTEVFRINQSTLDVTFQKAITIGGAPAPLNVTSQLLCTNLNADLLDSQHGPYYLDRANHTGTQLASTISDFSAATRAVTLTGISVVTGSPITSADTILSAFGKLQGQVNTNAASVSGTVGQLAYFNTASTISSSIVKQASGTLTVEGFLVLGSAANEKIRVSSDASNMFLTFTDTALTDRYSLHSQSTRLGFEVAGSEVFRINQSSLDVTFQKAITIGGAAAPLNVTSALLCTNLNADLLDGQHGTYYLDRANHTGTQLASTISNFSAATLAVTLTGLSIVTGSAITSADTILSAFGKLQGQVNTVSGSISGTAGQLAYFVTGTTIGNSIAKQASGTLTVEGFLVVGASANEKFRMSMDASNAYMHFTDSALTSRYAIHSQSSKLGFEVAGTEVFRINQSTADTTFVKAINISATVTAPLVVASTILVTSLNADLLDGQHGSYYLDRANHTGSQAISTITSLQTALDAKPTGTGVNNRFVVWTGTNTVASSNLFYNGGNVGVGMNPGYQFDVNGSIRYSSQLASTVATGTAPLDVTSTTLCTNLNADLLDGNHASAFALASHTHTASQITDFTSAARGVISGTGAISYNSSTGVISFTGSAGLGGSGTAGYIAKFTAGTTLGDSVILDTGSEINIGSARNFGVEGPTALRDYLHVHGYQSNGTASNHGSIVVHNTASATAHSSAAIEIRSTTKGYLPPRMTAAQRQAIPSPAVGLVVWQTDTISGYGPGTFEHIGSGFWRHSSADYVGA